VVPPDLAYGKDGYDPVVPRDATLRFVFLSREKLRAPRRKLLKMLR